MRILPPTRSRTATLLAERLLERYYRRRDAMSIGQRVRALRKVVLVLRNGLTHPDDLLRVKRGPYVG